MLIDRELKLDFSDVLIRPKRTTLTSRSQVELSRTIEMVHTKHQWTGVPIVAANMDTIATPHMAGELAKFEMSTALHKHFDVAELADFFTDYIPWDRLFYTVGIKELDEVKLKEVEAAIRRIMPSMLGIVPPDYTRKTFPLMLCIDVANGYMEKLAERVHDYREAYPKLVLLQILNFGLNELLYFILLSLHLPYQLALFIVLATLPLFTFTVSKFWIFQR